MRAAGIIWTIFGGLILLNFAILALILLVLAPAAPPGTRGAAIGATMCLGAFLGLIGGVFILVGIQTITGSARDTLGNGIGSIIFSLLIGGSGLVTLVGGRGEAANLIGGAINVLAGAGLMAAGVMALIGRDQYRAWRQAHSPPPPRRRHY